MAKEKYLMLHCTATPEGRDYSEARIRRWFTSRGWRNPGYRQVTHPDGSVTILQHANSDGYISSEEITNGARGWNSETIHFSYIGGVERYNIKKAKDTRTNEQKRSMFIQVWNALLLNPDLKILGHNQVSSKACPSFDVPDWLRSIGIPERNIVTERMYYPASFGDETGLFDLELTEDEL